MGERGGLILSLLFGGLILGTLLMLTAVYLQRIDVGLTSLGHKETSGSPVSPMDQAQKVKVQADLKSLSTQMIVYYIDYGGYPNTLEELITYTQQRVNISNVKYRRCSDHSAVFYHDSVGYPGYTFQYEQATPVSGKNPPSCP
ncbi:MAG TPA: type II secretion system protein GspG [Candidatus Nanoarchaeia archaeon]